MDICLEPHSLIPNRDYLICICIISSDFITTCISVHLSTVSPYLVPQYDAGLAANIQC